ncbi:coiled-coil domain-containing protein 68-like [Paramormyrops kingsleyae]|uniref:coiled-coil domain-containing protein 68-like n=1 Tax=Paramormyrops kingsleyae TaxID=1676925 RepID=UPI003B96EDF2
MTALQTHIVEQEHRLRKSTEDLKAMQRSLEVKQRKLSDLEQFLERMEKERVALKVKKDFIEHHVRRSLCEPRKAGPEAESLRKNKIEICTLEEKICHLDHLVHRQSSKMRTYLKQIKGLSAEVWARESAVESLTERLHAAQAQNVELKYKLEFWSSQDPKKNSLGMSV